MNSYGGYHHLPADSKEIVRIVESEEAPNLSIYELYPVNSSTIRNGWMSTDGTTFECNSYGYIGCASKLCKEFSVPELGTRHADETLLEHGWIKIVSGEWYGHWGKINDKQVLRLEELGIRHFADVGG